MNRAEERMKTLIEHHARTTQLKISALKTGLAQMNGAAIPESVTEAIVALESGAAAVVKMAQKIEDSEGKQS